MTYTNNECKLGTKAKYLIIGIVVLSIFIAVVISLFNNKASLSPIYSIGDFILNTYVSIDIYKCNDGIDKKSAEEIAANCLDICRTAEGKYSMYDENSELYKLNDKLSDNDCVIDRSSPLYDIIDTGIEYNTLTSGLFDITIGSVSSLWDFTGVNSVPPSYDNVNKFLARVNGGKHIQENTIDNTITLHSPLKIDLGGIAKGYICDQMISYLRSSGITDAVLSLGGNVFAMGTKNDYGWKIGIKDPDGIKDYICIVNISDRSVVTSGAYERNFTYDGVLYHHILDPATGFPGNSDIKSVTVISPLSVDGDALSTGCFLMGSAKAMQFIETISDAECIILTESNKLLVSSGIRSEDSYNFYLKE